MVSNISIAFSVCFSSVFFFLLHFRCSLMFAIVVARGQTMVVSWWLGQRCWVGEVVSG